MDNAEKLSDLDRIALKSGQLTADEALRFKRLSELQGRMSSMLIDRFRQNIEAFGKFIPSIAESFEHYRPAQALEFFCT